MGFVVRTKCLDAAGSVGHGSVILDNRSTEGDSKHSADRGIWVWCSGEPSLQYNGIALDTGLMFSSEEYRCCFGRPARNISYS